MGYSTPFVVALFVAHATCSVSMVLLNKTLASSFDYPWTVVLVQNIGTVFLGYLYPLFCPDGKAKNANEGHVGSDFKYAFGMKIPKRQKNLGWLVAQTTMFMVVLFLSLKALRFISVPLYVVSRNMVPAVTALYEKSLTGTEIPFVAAMGLCFTVLGALVYSWGDLNSGSIDLPGLSYALFLVLAVAGASVLDKTAVRILGNEEQIKPVEVNQIRVALSLPINMVLIFALELHRENKKLDIAAAPAVLDTWGSPGTGPELIKSFVAMTLLVKMCFFLSSIFGFGMGTFNFYLQQAVNATTVQVANILYKLITTIISRMTHPAHVAWSSWFGFAISLSGIGLYTFGPKLRKEWRQLLPL